MFKFAFVFVIIAFTWSPGKANPARNDNNYLRSKYGLFNKPTRSVGSNAQHPNEVGRQGIDSLWSPILDTFWLTSGPGPAAWTPRPSFTDCELQCHKFVTPEYDPQCGSDGLTYTNTGKVDCARRCGKDMKLRRGACEPAI